MTEKEKFAFPDPDVKPDDQLIFKKIGKNKEFWLAIMKHISDNYDDMQGGWRFYNDGKQWLYKMVQKKKTIFWGTILEGAFKITFYFGDKAETVIVDSDLPEKIKQQFLTGPRYGKIRAITVLVNDRTDVTNIEKLIEIKRKLK